MPLHSSTMEQEHDSLAAHYGQTYIYLLTFSFLPLSVSVNEDTNNWNDIALMINESSEELVE
jgi:hypothetical protein